MSKCKHDEVRILVTIQYEIQASVGFLDASVKKEWPVQLRVSVHCPQCPYTAVFTAYPNREDGYGWSRWPKWLMRRIGILSHESPAVHEALDEFKFSTAAYA